MRIEFLHAAENFQQGEVIFVQAAYNYPKNANYIGFSTEFVNTNKHIHNFVHGVLILTVCKELQQACKNILTQINITFCRADKKG